MSLSWQTILAVGVGGFFGLAGVAVELPISTTIMLRSIADIARSEGENLKSNDTKKACIEVFALGGKSKSDDASESGYFAVRTLLARSVTEASEFLSEKTIAEEGKVALRNIRQEANSSIKKIEELPEDEGKRAQEEVQDLINKYNKVVDEKLKAKEEELMSI